MKRSRPSSPSLATRTEARADQVPATVTNTTSTNNNSVTNNGSMGSAQPGGTHNGDANNTTNSAPAAAVVGTAAPAEGEAEDGIDASGLFPEEDRVHRELTGKKGQPNQTYVVSAVEKDLMAGCRNCTSKPLLCIKAFKPTRGAVKIHEFDEALKDFRAAARQGNLDEARKARGVLEGLRVDRCKGCMPLGHKTPMQLERIAIVNEAKEFQCRACDGCFDTDCIERGMQAMDVLVGEHDPETKDKRYNGSGVASYKKSIPPEQLRKEVAAMPFFCFFCTMLLPTSFTGNGRRNPKEMPPGKQKGTKEEKYQYNARKNATNLYEKQIFNDKLKREVGCCAQCRRKVLPGEESAFQWDHILEHLKMIWWLAKGLGRAGVSGIVNCNYARARLRAVVTGRKYVKVGDDWVATTATMTVREWILYEISLCQLLCASCHHRKTWGYTPREPFYWKRLLVHTALQRAIARNV